MSDQATPSIESLMKRGYLFLEDSDWTRAVEYFDRVLDIDPEYAPAYIGKLCAELEIENEANLANYFEDLDEIPHFQKALRFADAEYREKIVGYQESIRQKQEQITEEQRIESDEKIARLKQNLHEHEAKHELKLTEYKSELRKWQEITGNLQEQANVWKAQKLCPHCGGKVGFFGSCKICKKDSSASIQLPPSPTPVPTHSSVPRFNINIGGYDWRVLDVQNGKVLLLSSNIIFVNQYHNNKQNITWENCTLRQYLNEEFHNAFNVGLKALIVESHIINEKNQWCNTSGGRATDDKIFLLSLDEVVRYFGDSGALKNRPTTREYDVSVGYWNRGLPEINDKYNSARIARNLDGNVHFWWLRSPGAVKNSAAFVDKDGKIAVIGVDISVPVGVRPALWLRIE